MPSRSRFRMAPVVDDSDTVPPGGRRDSPAILTGGGSPRSASDQPDGLADAVTLASTGADVLGAGSGGVGDGAGLGVASPPPPDPAAPEVAAPPDLVVDVA